MNVVSCTESPGTSPFKIPKSILIFCSPSNTVNPLINFRSIDRALSGSPGQLVARAQAGMSADRRAANGSVVGAGGQRDSGVTRGGRRVGK